MLERVSRASYLPLAWLIPSKLLQNLGTPDVEAPNVHMPFLSGLNSPDTHQTGIEPQRVYQWGKARALQSTQRKRNLTVIMSSHCVASRGIAETHRCQIKNPSAANCAKSHQVSAIVLCKLADGHVRRGQKGSSQVGSQIRKPSAVGSTRAPWGKMLGKSSVCSSTLAKSCDDILFL